MLSCNAEKLCRLLTGFGNEHTLCASCVRYWSNGVANSGWIVQLAHNDTNALFTRKNSCENKDALHESPQKLSTALRGRAGPIPSVL